jgi:hypothetical protein
MIPLGKVDPMLLMVSRQSLVFWELFHSFAAMRSHFLVGPAQFRTGRRAGRECPEMPNSSGRRST